MPLFRVGGGALCAAANAIKNSTNVSVSLVDTMLERHGAHVIVPARSVGADKCAAGSMLTTGLLP